MKVKLRFFAALRERFGAGEELDLPEKVNTVGALRDHLRARGGEWAAAFAANRPVRAAVNQDMAQGDVRIKPGDEIAFFPPVTGG